MTYEEAESYINDTPKFTKKNTLENTRMVLDAMGHPERKMKFDSCGRFQWKRVRMCISVFYLKSCGKRGGTVHLSASGKDQ